MIINIISIFIICTGLVFFIGGAVGILRFPDFYTRMHAAGKGDTCSMLLILAGMALYQLHVPSLANFLVVGKMIFIAMFIMSTGPTSTHALIKAGFEEGIKMWTRGKKEEGK
ncbi:MAG: monovalent cation/H(+) antiporter subunit G [Verrucomicrobia bacterium]|nr:monovalent cation/H(+) antiporter subunit G [Verrucomicrobiota bacterium]MDA1067738.1 monovalent cation/H(+) antiporter subunit G [Verrucomicrobiota bacterium]